MVEFGYAMSSEEHTPQDLIRNACRAEEIGFTFALISDHFHPWIDKQGHAPFVWSVIGGIAQMTKTLRLGTGVTCPMMRIHPAIIAQAAATSAAMMPGRFFLGVGTGEALNEHIFADPWPPTPIRQEMLRESIEVMRKLWTGDEISHYGEFYTVENARLYTLPDQPIPVYVAASGPGSAELAGEIGDGLISTKADEKVVDNFKRNGGRNKPKIGQVKVVYARSEAEALDTLYTYWPTASIPGTLHADLSTPAHFEDAAKLVKKEDLASVAPLGPDPKRHMDEIQKMIDTGFDHIYIHQVGPNQEDFFTFYQHEILPHLKGPGR